MSPKRVGGKSQADSGVDLLGWWWLPISSDSQSPMTPPHRCIRVLAQCNAEKKKFSPNYVREMENVCHICLLKTAPLPKSIRVPEQPEVTGTVALLTESKFNTATLIRTLGPRVPFLLVHLPPLISSDLHIETMLGEVGPAFR
ncbi:hypothetical protein EV702DRAFT_1196567 [Suillus placidus]|uniref:Uncharacterized protein n=1 Tax=Suillus placidus TaxID=48579 RepID=A0A9P6ZWP7_9AGAM|nr:hypothetical protein EV702DRAFT_1196567 [Suillus placidus]